MKYKSSQGQTLIETLIAIFILTMALTTALGLVIYVFSNSDRAMKEIIATNLASEGLDVIRMFRDSNWLIQDASNDSQSILQPCPELNGQNCYPLVFNSIDNSFDFAACLNPCSTTYQRIIFDPVAGNWNFDTNHVADYDLYLQPDGTYTDQSNSSPPIFARMLYFVYNVNSTYPTTGNSYAAEGTELTLQSVVAWRGRGCTDFSSSQNLLTLSTPCKVIQEDHLTNWKDYQ